MQLVEDPAEEISIPAGATSVSVSVDRAGIPDDGQWGHIELTAELSLDDGNTWGDGCFVDESDGQVPLAFSLMFGVTSSIYSPDVKSTGFNVALPPVANARLRIAKRIAEGLAAPNVTTEFGFSPYPKRQLLKDVHHSVAFDAVTPVSGLSGASGFTTSATATGANRLALVGYGFVVGAGSTVATITYGGVSMSRVGADATRSDFNGGTFTGFAGIWQLVAPATGSQTVILTASGGGTLFGAAGICTYTGVDQTTPLGTPVSANGSSTTASAVVTGTLSGNAVFASLLYDIGAGIPSPNNNSRYLNDNAGTGGIGFTGGGQDAAGGGSITSSWTKATSKPWAVQAVELLAPNTGSVGAAAGTGTASGVGVAGSGSTANGVGTATGVGAAAKASVGAASGVGTATGLNGVALNIGVIAPYLTTDTIGTKTLQVYHFPPGGGSLVAWGSAQTTGFVAIPGITNGWMVNVSVLSDGAYGDFCGVAVFSNINGSDKRAVPLYSPPQSVPASLNLIAFEQYALSDTPTPGYQLYDINGSAVGGHVLSGIVAVPGVTNCYAALVTTTPDAHYGSFNFIKWD